MITSLYFLSSQNCVKIMLQSPVVRDGLNNNCRKLNKESDYFLVIYHYILFSSNYYIINMQSSNK